MKIHGLQKMTLLDYPGHVAATVFLGGCEYRCPFCHNAEILDMNAPAEMDEKEFLRFLETRHGLLDGVAITGGEPLLRPDIAAFVEMIRDAGYRVKLDTNGNHPDRLKALLDKDLIDYVAMDIKNSPEKYAETVGLATVDLSNIEESIRLLGEYKKAHPSFDYEFRTTVVDELHDESSFRAIAPMIAGAPHYFLQAFTDRDSVVFGDLHAPSKEKMEMYAAIVRPFVGSAQLRGVD